MKRFFLAGLAAASLAGCATAVGTAYGPADSKGYGFADTRIEQDRYRITFAGDGATDPQTVEDFALLRAAEIARANGYDWFRVVSVVVDVEQKGGVGLGAGVGGGGRNVGVGVSGDLGTIGARKFYTARLEALFGKGDRPGDQAGVYDAASVIATIGARAKGER